MTPGIVDSAGFLQLQPRTMSMKQLPACTSHRSANMLSAYSSHGYHICTQASAPHSHIQRGQSSTQPQAHHTYSGQCFTRLGYSLQVLKSRRPTFSMGNDDTLRIVKIETVPRSYWNRLWFQRKCEQISTPPHCSSPPQSPHHSKRRGHQ